MVMHSLHMTWKRLMHCWHVAHALPTQDHCFVGTRMMQVAEYLRKAAREPPFMYSVMMPMTLGSAYDSTTTP